MFEVYQFNEIEIIGFALALIRIASCIIALPFFGNNQIPQPMKVLLSLAITLALFPVIRPTISFEGLQSNHLLLLALRETLVGVFFGFLARFLFMAVSISGQVIGFSLGLSAASLMDPTNNESGTVMDQFQNLLAMLLFLAINGHHILLTAIHKSFALIHLGDFTFAVENMAAASLLAQKVLVIGIQLAGPILAVVWFLNIAMGIVGRAVPQVNTFVAAFPVNFLVGMMVMIMSVPLMLSILEVRFNELGAEIFKYMKGF